MCTWNKTQLNVRFKTNDNTFLFLWQLEQFFLRHFSQMTHSTGLFSVRIKSRWSLERAFKNVKVIKSLLSEIKLAGRTCFHQPLKIIRPAVNPRLTSMQTDREPPSIQDVKHPPDLKRFVSPPRKTAVFWICKKYYAEFAKKKFRINCVAGRIDARIKKQINCWKWSRPTLFIFSFSRFRCDLKTARLRLASLGGKMLKCVVQQHCQRASIFRFSRTLAISEKTQWKETIFFSLIFSLLLTISFFFWKCVVSTMQICCWIFFPPIVLWAVFVSSHLLVWCLDYFLISILLNAT